MGNIVILRSVGKWSKATNGYIVLNYSLQHLPPEKLIVNVFNSGQLLLFYSRKSNRPMRKHLMLERRCASKVKDMLRL